jgi:hypothetical protein
MLQLMSNPTEVNHHVVAFPTRPSAHIPPECTVHSAARPAANAKVRVRTHVILQVLVLEVAGRLRDVVEDLDRAIQLALAEGLAGVVCDLSLVFEGAGADAVEMLATLGRHVRYWPGIPVAVAVVCPDPRVREALRAHPLGGHLIVTASMLPAVSSVRVRGPAR